MSFKRIALLGLFLFVVNITLYSQKDNTENYNIHSLKQSNFLRYGIGFSFTPIG